MTNWKAEMKAVHVSHPNEGPFLVVDVKPGCCERNTTHLRFRGFDWGLSFCRLCGRESGGHWFAARMYRPLLSTEQDELSAIEQEVESEQLSPA